MFSRIVMLCAGIALLSNNAMGQDGPPVTRDEFNQLVQTVHELAAGVKQNADDTKNRLAELQAVVASVSDIQSEDRAQLAQLAKKDKNGRSFVRLDASHEETRLEVQHAVARSMPVSGKVVLVNDMGHDQLVAVNGITYNVIADSRREIPTEVGAFRIRLPGQQTEIRYLLPFKDTKIRIHPQEIATNTIRWINEPIYYVYR
jgi:hypothetical protein